MVQRLRQKVHKTHKRHTLSIEMLNVPVCVFPKYSMQSWRQPILTLPPSVQYVTAIGIPHDDDDDDADEIKPHLVFLGL